MSHGKRIHGGQVSSHSLRAGGAMAMKLSGAMDSTILRIGRWTYLTYLTYPLPDWGALGRCGIENVPTIHVSERWVTGGGAKE